MTEWKPLFPFQLGEDVSSTEMKCVLAEYDTPVLVTPALTSGAKVPYWTEPRVRILAWTTEDFEQTAYMMRENGAGEDVIEDHVDADGFRIAQVAGQLCYKAFSGNRTKFTEHRKYLNHILESGHGSVLEHWSATVYIGGISRLVTHELVRHRHAGYSQVSTRYVDSLSFVLRPEIARNERLVRRFEKKIEQDVEHYEETVSALLVLQEEGDPSLAADSSRRSDMRKRVRQGARESLPHCLEAPIIVTMNGRAWRHFFHMRCAEAADVEMRRMAVKVFFQVAELYPEIFQDAEIATLKDGTTSIRFKYGSV